ncbi:thioredoxin-like [Lithobates pipiens]
MSDVLETVCLRPHSLCVYVEGTVRSVHVVGLQWAIMVKQIESAKEFEAFLTSAGDKLVVVDFTASWCGPCRRIAPIYEELSKTHSDVFFCKVDVDDVTDLSESCGIKAMPTFQFYKNKAKVGEICGADEAKLKETIAKLK